MTTVLGGTGTQGGTVAREPLADGDLVVRAAHRKPVSYNTTIAAGATTSFGFSANVNSTNDVPALTCATG